MGPLRALSQLPRNELEEVARGLVFTVDPKLQRVGRFYHGMLLDRDKGKEQVKALFNQFNEEILLDRLYEVEVLSKARDEGVRVVLLEKLDGIKRQLRRPILKERINAIVARLQEEGKVEP